MPELLRLQTPDFELSVWANDITKRSMLYRSTLIRRETYTEQLVMRFDPPLVKGSFWVDSLMSAIDDSDGAVELVLGQASSVLLPNPLFFENTQYQFEWVFLQPVSNAYVAHRSRAISNAFRFAPQSRHMPARLTGTINTANDVGWMRLPLCYTVNAKVQTQLFSLEVLPIKMALHQDLPMMYEAIDRTFPLWRFSLIQKTEQQAQRSKLRGQFPLMWLANFTELRQRFEQGLKVVCAAPHSRLMSFVVNTKAARLKGRISHKLSERVKQDLAIGNDGRHYRVEKKSLNVDIPENRFIKMVISQSKQQLARFEARLRSHNAAPQDQRFSEAFLSELQAWQLPLQKVLNQSFLTEVGEYSEPNRESLVLQQKTGYSGVYRVWQELRFYMDMFGSQSSISMKSVAEIYEIWCFLQIKHVLEQELGFVMVANQQTNLSLNSLFEYQLKDGFAGAFEFERADGVKARLAHEPKFSEKSFPIRTYLVSQEPDIVLEVTLPPNDLHDAKQFVWLFDAKYRIKVGKIEPSEGVTDLVPEDAINQMHRYRDALIHLSTLESRSVGSGAKSSHKSRPVFGAFVLYPGFFDQEKQVNPYAEAITEIGIGAFALLPYLKSESAVKPNTSGHAWLSQFLTSQIGELGRDKRYASSEMTERIYVQEAARIPSYGMRQTLYSDLVLTAALGTKVERDQAYFESFEQGKAKWYHMPQATFEAKFKRNVAAEIRYMGLAFSASQNVVEKQIMKLWPVKNASLVPRSQINRFQSGKESTSKDLYYLFELGKPLTLQQPICNVKISPMTDSMVLTTLSLLEKVSCFTEVKTVYVDS